MTRIAGYQAMSEALAAAGQTVTVEHTGGGVMTVYVWYADGTDLAMSDCFNGPGHWGYCHEVSETGEWIGEETDTRDAAAVIAHAQQLAGEHGGPLDPKTEGMFVDGEE